MAAGINVIPLIYNGISEGKSGRQILREFRAAGGAIRTQRFQQAMGEIQIEVATRGLVEAAPASRQPSPEEISQRSTSKPGGFLYRTGVLVSRTVVDPISGRTSEQTTIEWQSIRTAQLIDYAQAQQAAEANFGVGGAGGPYGGSVVGSFVSAVNELVPEQPA